MKSYWDESIYCSAFSRIDSLDAHLGSDGELGDDDIVDPSADVPNAVDVSRVERAVDRFLSTLSSRDRDIVLRLFWHGQRQSQVAAALGVSRMAVCKAVKRIAKCGRSALADYKDCVLLQ